MSNVIRFLETLGSNQALSAADYAANVAALKVDAAERKALLDRNHQELNDLSQGRAKMHCMIMTADESEA